MATKNDILGDYIREVNNRNSANINNLYGLSMTKEFRKSTSNIIGVDLSKYKIVKQDQFACDFMSPIRVNKLPVVINKTGADIIVSPAYPVFEVKDKNVLDPDYLMLWFRRPEFDRHVVFQCDGGVRGGYGWKELCNEPITIPDIKIQREIVSKYNATKERIKILNESNAKLERIIYNYFLSIVPDDEQPLSECCDVILGGTPSRDNPSYWGGNIGWINSGAVNNYRILEPSEFITEAALRKSAAKLMPIGTTVLAITGATLGQYSRLCEEFCANQSVIGIVPKKSSCISNEFIYLAIKKNLKKLLSGQTGGAQPHINSNDVKNLSIPKSTPSIEEKINKNMLPIFNLIELNCREILLLDKLSHLLFVSHNADSAEVK